MDFALELMLYYFLILQNIKKNAKVLDLGTGTGIISILLCGKTNLRK